MHIGDLVKFKKSGEIGTIVHTSSDFGGYAVVWISGDVTFKNPTHMNINNLKKHAEVISESR
jgi:hypothetical protein